MTLAKGIASGMPLGAMIANAKLMDWQAGSHASTFGGNPVSCRAALATIDLLEKGLIDNAAARGQQLMAALREMQKSFECMGDVRGKGLMVGVELVKDRVTKDSVPDLRNTVVQTAFNRGLLLLGCGESTIRFCPPSPSAPRKWTRGFPFSEETLRKAKPMRDLLVKLGIGELNQGALYGLNSLECRGETLESVSPIDGKILAKIKQADSAAYDDVVKKARAAFMRWRDVPAPKRGELVRRIGAAFREKKKDLGELISLEMGKIRRGRRRGSTGIDRHVRFRRRSVPYALRIFHAQRKNRTSHVRTVSSAWPHWGYHCIQLSGCRMVLERHAGAYCRRYRSSGNRPAKFPFAPSQQTR